MLAVSELIFVTTIAATTALIARSFLISPPSSAPCLPDVSSEPLALLFDDGILHHGNTDALKRFVFAPGTHVWDDLHDILIERFPDFPELPQSGAAGSIRIRPKDIGDRSEIEMNWRDGLCWVHMYEPVGDDRAAGRMTQDAGPSEHCIRTMPHPAWETDETGRLVWKNDAYNRLVSDIGVAQNDTLFALDPTKQKQRCLLTGSGDENEWFEIETHAVARGGIHHATPVTALVRAEEAQRSFVQTLAKTFAHLPIGLAIFDNRGQLGIFNPALVDLSGLQASFLATHPTMLGFFDALRENRRMPEPKNYRSWRQDITDVIAAASDGQYHETWSLEDGRTYTVQSRQHPDGTTAFLIEDISAEVTLSRNYRAELEQFEALLDSVDDALVVFSATGVLTFCNAAYRRMWGHAPEASFADMTLHDALKLWAPRVANAAVLSELSRFGTTIGSRPDQSCTLDLVGGERLCCRLRALSGDAMMLRFSHVAKPATADTASITTPA